MGPEYFYSGKLNPLGDQLIFDVLLQWGRSISTPERKQFVGIFPADSLGFNGAGVFLLRKVRSGM